MRASDARKPDLEQLPRPWYLIPSRLEDREPGFPRVRKLDHELVIDGGAHRGPPITALLMVLFSVAIIGVLVLERLVRGTSFAARGGFYGFVTPVILPIAVGAVFLIVRQIRAARRGSLFDDAAPVLRLDTAAGILFLPADHWQIDACRVIGLEGVRQWPPEFRDSREGHPHQAQLLLTYIDGDGRVRRRVVMPDVTEGFWLERRGPSAAVALGLSFRLTDLASPAAMLPLPRSVPGHAADPLVTPEHQWPPPTHCLRCGYPRRGLDDAGACPECGHVVDDSKEMPIVRWG